MSEVVDSFSRDSSVNERLLLSLQSQVLMLDSLRRVDSLQKVSLEEQLTNLKASDEIKRVAIEQQLGLLRANETKYEEARLARLDSLRQNAVGYPVMGLVNDTVFMLYMRVGSYGPKQRAKVIHERLRLLYEEGISNSDTLKVVLSEEDYADVVFKDHIMMTVTQNEALWHNTTVEELAEEYSDALTEAVHRANDEFSTTQLLKRIGLLILSILGLYLMIRLINLAIRWLKVLVEANKDKWFKDWTYKDYTIISNRQEVQLLGHVISVLRVVLIIVAAVFMVPVIFSIFPFSRDWAGRLSELLLTPIRELGISIWNFLPNLLIIAFIYIVMRVVSRLTKYFFTEIELARLRLPGFLPEFAKPTYTIVRILLIAFFLILIFPYLPGSGSPAFNGISIFVGILVSLGSSSAIANMIAGIVITYMRPFRDGDRIKIDDITGDVVEKNLLVTRVRTVTNEEVTIPNSKILSASTVNYSSLAESKGLILSVEVTFGYEVPWQRVQEVLLEAIGRCDRILKAPKPFMLQMGFADNYVVYLINGYTTYPNAQAGIYSEIRGHIQDVCREYNLELLSPHYRAYRDGNATTVPPEYHPTKKAPQKNAPIDHEEEKEKRHKEQEEWYEKQREREEERIRMEQLKEEQEAQIKSEGLQSEGKKE